MEKGGQGGCWRWESSVGPCVCPRLVNTVSPPHPFTELEPLLEHGDTAGDSPQREDGLIFRQESLEAGLLTGCQEDAGRSD